MADIIDEVIIDKQEEQKLLYFKRSIPIVIIFTILIVIGMIINDYRKSKRVKHNKEIGDTIIHSLENMPTNPSLGLQGLDFVIENADNHGQDIAMLQKLAASIHTNSTETALELTQDIITDSKYLPLTQGYAKLTWLSIKLDEKALSKEDETKMKEYFDSYTEHTAFYGSAHLLEALWYKSTNKEKSRAILEHLISSRIVTDTLKEEAKALMSNLTIEN